MVLTDGRTIHIETKTQKAVFENGFLTSLKSKASGEELVPGANPNGSALQLVYGAGEICDVIGNLAAQVSVHRLSDQAAQFRFSGWDADGVSPFETRRAISWSSRRPTPRGRACSCRWRLRGCRTTWIW